MWYLVQTELKYNLNLLLPLAGLFIIYGVLGYLGVELWSEGVTNTDLLGSMYSLLVYLFMTIIWAARYKEQRERNLRGLPVSTDKLAKSRYLTALLPFLFFLIYLIILNFFLDSTWQLINSSLIGQTGLCVIFMGLIFIITDVWRIFDQKESLKKMVCTIIVFVIFISLIGGIFLLLPQLYKFENKDVAYAFFIYSKVIFYIVGFLFLSYSVSTYKKRKIFT